VTSIINIKLWGLIKLMGYYDDIAEGYDELHGAEQLVKLKLIAKHLNVDKNTKILDVGCGTGLSKKVFNCNITGIDPSEELLKQCSFKTIKAEAESMPFKDNEFDVVIAVTCIHNFKDINQGLREIKRVGKNKFVLTVLKKSDKKEFILNKIKTVFQVQKVLEDEKDLILLSGVF
jgi:ubiquinone/menaquinone biosynthesis C-methylase UbiE